jgi:hypothetical protein
MRGGVVSLAKSTPGGSWSQLGPVTTPGGIAVDANRVYWGDLSIQQIRKAPLDGGMFQTVASGLFDGGVVDSGVAADPVSLAVDPTNGNVYWTNQTTGTVVSAPIDGGSATLVAPTDGGATEVGPISCATDSTYVYWCNLNSGQVRQAKIPRDPSPTWPLADTLFPVTMTSASTDPAAVAVDSTAVYWGNYLPPNYVWTTPIGEMNPSQLAPAMGDVFSIAVDATSVYWTTANTTANGTVYNVYKTAKVRIPGAMPILLATSTNGVPSSVAVDDKYVYWINRGTANQYADGSVTAVAK